MTDSLPAETERITRVLLADDHEPYRQGLRAFLDALPDIQVVGEAGSGRAAVQLAGELDPDIAVMDVAMADLNGTEATRLIKESFPAVKVLALSMHGEWMFVKGMIAAGASGYVRKENAFSRLASAIRIIIGGGTYMCPDLG